MNFKFALTALLSTATLAGTVVVSNPAHAWPCSKSAPVTEVPSNPTNLVDNPPTFQSNLLSGGNLGYWGMGIAAIATLMGGGLFLKSRLSQSPVAPVHPVTGPGTGTEIERAIVAHEVSAEAVVDEAFEEPRLGLVLSPEALKPVKPLEETESDPAAIQ